MTPRLTVTESCPRCGSAREDGPNCPSCGLEFACHACGSAYENPLTDRFCAECGERMTRQEIDADVGFDTAAEPKAVAEPPGSALRAKARGVAEAASAASGRLAGIRAIRRSTGKSAPPRPVEQLELELAWALVRLGEFEAGREMFARALADNARQVDMLLGIAADSAEASAADVAVRALLEVALHRPEESRAHVGAAHELVDACVIETYGNWIATEWYPQIKRRHADRTLQAQSALLLCRVAMLIPDEHLAQKSLEEACVADRARVDGGASSLLQDENVAAELQGSGRAEAMLARLNATAGRPRRALEHLDAALGSDSFSREEESDLLALRGEQLRQLGESAQASASYLEAGRLAELATRHRRASRHFRRATELDPSSAVASWYLADSLRLSADLAEYPYVDGDALQAARESWRRGIRMSLPEPGQAWVHLSGALIFEQVARIADDPTEWMLRAVIQAEQACALDGSADAWAMAGRYARLRRRFNVAVHAAAFALALDDQNANANYERVLNSVITAAPDAIVVLDDYESRFVPERDPVTVALRGYALMLAGDLTGACESLRRAADADPTDIWALTRLALCLALSGDRKASQAEAARAWRISAEANRARGPMHADVRAVAGLLTEALDEAEEQFGIGMRMAWFNPVELRVGRAVASYKRGDPSEALLHVRDAAQHVRHPGDVQAGRLYLGLLRHWGDEDGGAGLDAVWEELSAAQAWPVIDGSVDHAAAELEEAGRPGDTVTAAWLGARAGLGRVLASERRWQDAVAVDEQLVAFDDAVEGVPAIKHRLRSTVTAAIHDPSLRDDAALIRSFTHRLAELERMTEAEEALAVAMAARRTVGREAALAEADRAASLATLAGDLASLRQSRALQGEILHEAGRTEEARTRFLEALAASPASTPPPSALGCFCGWRASRRRVTMSSRRIVNCEAPSIFFRWTPIRQTRRATCESMPRSTLMASRPRRSRRRSEPWLRTTAT